MDNQRRRMFSTYLMNPQQRQRMERAYGNVTNRMVNYLQAKGIQERYDSKDTTVKCQQRFVKVDLQEV